MKKWIFSIQNEIDLCRDELAENFIFYQAIEDVNRGLIRESQSKITIYRVKFSEKFY